MSAIFRPLLHTVVAGGAQRLPVPRIPEERLVAAMRGDVIHHRRRAAAHRAVRMRQQKLGTGLAPPVIVATLSGRGAARIMPGVPGTGAGDLASTARAMRDGAATCADMGRARHGSPEPEQLHERAVVTVRTAAVKKPRIGRNQLFEKKVVQPGRKYLLRAQVVQTVSLKPHGNGDVILKRHPHFVAISVAVQARFTYQHDRARHHGQIVFIAGGNLYGVAQRGLRRHRVALEGVEHDLSRISL